MTTPQTTTNPTPIGDRGARPKRSGLEIILASVFAMSIAATAYSSENTRHRADGTAAVRESADHGRKSHSAELGDTDYKATASGELGDYDPQTTGADGTRQKRGASGSETPASTTRSYHSCPPSALISRQSWRCWQGKRGHRFTLIGRTTPLQEPHGSTSTHNAIPSTPTPYTPTSGTSTMHLYRHHPDERNK